MKVVIRVLLAIAIVLLGFLCWKSIQGPIDFRKEVDKRDKDVIQHLVDIRTAQIAYRARHGKYTASFDTLIAFVREGKISIPVKSGDLTEKQLEDGMTEEKAMNIIRTGDERKIRQAGLWDDAKNAPQLMRDSIFSPAVEVLYPNRKNISLDSLRYVPHSGGARFEMGIGNIQTTSGYEVHVFEVKTPFETYLGDLNHKLLEQKIQEAKDRPVNNYPGRMVGSLTTVNNNAGNWE